jgi:hypothetical protein
MKIFWITAVQIQVIILIVYGLVFFVITFFFNQKCPLIILPISMSIVFFMNILAEILRKTFDWIEQRFDKKS